MKITPLEIRQKTFEKAFRGLDKDEVAAFLLTLSQEWEKMLDENKELRLKLEAAGKEVQKMREVESSLYRTLKTAEDTGNNMMEQATRSAELKLREAQLQADQLLNDSRLKARSVIEDAYKQSEKAIDEMQHEVKQLEQEHQRMENYLESLVRDLKNLATDALDKVEKSNGRPRTYLSGILSQAANIKVKQVELSKELKDVYSTHSVDTITVPAPAATQRAEQLRPQPVTAQNPIEPMPGTPDQNPIPDVPSPTGPDIERPRPDIPDIPSPAPEIERPVPEIGPITPDIPEVQPPSPQPPSPQPGGPSFGAPKPENKPVAQPVGSGSFFDELD